MGNLPKNPPYTEEHIAAMSSALANGTADGSWILSAHGIDVVKPFYKLTPQERMALLAKGAIFAVAFDHERATLVSQKGSREFTVLRWMDAKDTARVLSQVAMLEHIAGAVDQERHKAILVSNAQAIAMHDVLRRKALEKSVEVSWLN